MDNLADVFLSSARAYPNRPALWVDGVLFSYAQLLEEAQRIAGGILCDTACSMAPVAVLAQRSWPAYAGILGAVLAGKTYVPLNPRFPQERNAAIASAASVGAIVADVHTAAAAASIQDVVGADARVILPDARQEDFAWKSTAMLDKDDLSAAAPAAADAQNATAYIMFTSGTTGAPKGVEVTNRNVLQYLATMREMLALTPEDRCTQLFDFSFDLSVHDLFVSWAAGACLYVLPRDANLQTIDFVRQHALTSWFSVPSAASFARRFRQLRAGVLPSLRLSLFCGEALPISTAKVWSEAAPNSEVLNLYGPTEATIAITAYRYSAVEDLGDCRSVPIGAAFKGQEAVVVDGEGREAPLGKSGELLLGGTQVSKGYLDNPAANREKFIEKSIQGRSATRWYRTGDLCTTDKAFGLIFLGRMDDQLKIGGYRVELMEVETTLRRVCCNDVAAAVPWPVDESGAVQGLVAFVCAPGLTEQEVLSRMAQSLPPYMVPRRVVALEIMPFSTSGKIDRRKLRELCESFDRRTKAV